MVLFERNKINMLFSESCTFLCGKQLYLAVHNGERIKQRQQDPYTAVAWTSVARINCYYRLPPCRDVRIASVRDNCLRWRCVAYCSIAQSASTRGVLFNCSRRRDDVCEFILSMEGDGDCKRCLACGSRPCFSHLYWVIQLNV